MGKFWGMTHVNAEESEGEAEKNEGDQGRLREGFAGKLR